MKALTSRLSSRMGLSWMILLVILGLIAPSSSCDVSSGRWVQDAHRGPTYDGARCSPFFCKGRDVHYLKYRWDAPGCIIARFNAPRFLNRLRNKVMAVVGDSLSKNLFSSIICSASTSTRIVPMKPGRLSGPLVYGYTAPAYNATIVMILSPFLVEHDTINKRHVVYASNADGMWAARLRFIDVIAFGGLHNYFHRNVVFMRGRWGGYVGTMKAIQGAMLSVRAFVRSQKYKGLAMVVTLSPAHGGDAYPGGGHQNCAQSRVPFLPSQEWKAEHSTTALTVRNIQAKVFSPTSGFKLVDITRLSMYRPDGHPGSAQGTRFVSSADCAHWCLPGVPDTWLDIMFSIMVGKL